MAFLLCTNNSIIQEWMRERDKKLELFINTLKGAAIENRGGNSGPGKVVGFAEGWVWTKSVIACKAVGGGSSSPVQPKIFFGKRA